jgi:hypothetical protein
MTAHRFVAVVGARVLPGAWAHQVGEVVRFFAGRGWGVGSGGARGADAYALHAVLACGRAACARSVVFLPGPVGVWRHRDLRSFKAQGGRVVLGAGVGRAALLARSRRLVQESSGVVAFLWGPSRGSVFTVREAIRSGKPVAVVLAGGGAVLPVFSSGAWVLCSIGSVAAFRWVPAPAGQGREPDEAATERQPTTLHRIFVVPDGEPVQALMEHVASLSQGERLWFEQGVLAGDTVLVPHEALSDTPAFLSVRRLMSRCRCSAQEAVDLTELFLALDADRTVVAHYEAEARRRGVASVIDDLVHLVAQLELIGQASSSDALEDAERFGDGVELVSTDGVAPALAATDESVATLGWHTIGCVYSERVGCPGCGHVYEADDDAVEIPACPECGTPDTWEARQGPAFRQLIAEIDGCVSLAELAALGKRLYAQALSHDQAGVIWSRYRLRKSALERALTLGAPARALVARVERAGALALPRLGAQLYRLQHASATPIAPPEWRRIWQAYQARRLARPA